MEQLRMRTPRAEALSMVEWRDDMKPMSKVARMLNRRSRRSFHSCNIESTPASQSGETLLPNLFLNPLKFLKTLISISRKGYQGQAVG